MRRTRLDFIVVAIVLALALLSSACGSVTPTSPSESNPPTAAVTPPVPPTPPTSTVHLWSELPPLSQEAKQYLIEKNLNRVYPGTNEMGAVKKWSTVTIPIPIHVADFEPADVTAAVALWENEAPGKFHFMQVDDPDSHGMVMNMQWPPPDTVGVPESACGSEGVRHVEANTILFGVGNYAFLAKPKDCQRNATDQRIALAHGIGLMLGLGTTSSGIDIMSNPNTVWKVSPLVHEALNWLYDPRVEPGIKPQ